MWISRTGGKQESDNHQKRNSDNHFANCQYLLRLCWKKPYHASDDITPQINVVYTVSYLLISGPNFKLIKVFERVYIFLLGYKVRKKAKIRNRYNQAPHLTQDTTWDSDKTTTHHIQESREVTPFPAGDHKATMNWQKTWQIRTIIKQPPVFFCHTRIWLGKITSSFQWCKKTQNH